MVDLLIRLLVRLYPRRWRTRYGSELNATACEAYHRGSQGPFAIAADLLIGSLRQRVPTLTHRTIALGAPIVLALVIVSMALFTGNDPTTTEHMYPTSPSAPIAHRSTPSTHSASMRTKRHTTGGRRQRLLKIVIDPDNGHVISVSRLSAHVLINPETGRLYKVRSTA
jgi:hypothetical protein